MWDFIILDEKYWVDSQGRSMLGAPFVLRYRNINGATADSGHSPFDTSGRMASRKSLPEIFRGVVSPAGYGCLPR